MKTYPCVESTVEIVRHNKTVRLWIDETDQQTELSQNRVHQTLRLIEPILNEALTAREVLDKLSEIPHINAAQIIDRSFTQNDITFGRVVYYVDFDEMKG